MMFQAIKIFFVVSVFAKFSEACNGYHLKLNHINLCNDNSIIQTKNIELNLDKECNIYYSGCINILKTIKTAKTTYEISKAPLPPLTGELDMCQLVSNSKFSQLSQVFAGFGIPKKCPVAAKNYCTNGKKSTSISSFKNNLAMAAGDLLIKLDSEHDSGRSCIEISATLSKKK